VVAGRLDLDETATGSVGTFVYGRSYLGRQDALPIDPVTLPLHPGAKEFTALGGFPAVILDACPDRWGIKVIDRLSGKLKFPIGYLLMNDPGRSGSLAFSTAASDLPVELESREFALEFVSARTVFYADPGFATMGTGSYGRLARWMTRYGCEVSEQRQLFRRMVFNVAVRNSDDHELNHGLVHDQGRYRLAEAYDILPVMTANRVHHHALLIGDSAAGTVENLLSNASAFGLSREEARSILREVEEAIQAHWQDVFYSAGFGDKEIKRIDRYFAAIPREDDTH